MTTVSFSPVTSRDRRKPLEEKKSVLLALSPQSNTEGAASNQGLERDVRRRNPTGTGEREHPAVVLPPLNVHKPRQQTRGWGAQDTGQK